MHSDESKSDKSTVPVSDHMLGNIVEQGFFAAPGSLAAARSACGELIFARAMIDAQTAAIEALNSRLAIDLQSNREAQPEARVRPARGDLERGRIAMYVSGS